MRNSEESIVEPRTPSKAAPAKIGKAAWTWSRVTPDSYQFPTSARSLVPCQRSLHAAAVHRDTLYVFGGYDGSSRLNDFFGFNFNRNTKVRSKRYAESQSWFSIDNAGHPPSPRDRHVAVVHGNSFYIFAGFDGTKRVNDFYEYSFVTNLWGQVLTVSGVPPSPRHSHAAVVVGSSMYCFGGYDGSYRNDFHEYNFEAATWKQVTTTGRTPRARYRASCIAHGNKMYLFGGHDGSRHLNDVHVFDFELRAWSSLQADGPSPIPRDSHVSVVHGNSMFVFGGSTGIAMNDFHELRLTESPPRWKSVQSTSMIPGQRFCHVACVYNDSMYIFGGYDGCNRLNDFQEFHFGSDTFTVEDWDVPRSTLINDLKQFANSELLSDVTFVVEDRPVYAHKILCMRCNYFRAMLTGEMMESRAREVVIPDVRYPIFTTLLEYLYTDEIDVQLDNAMEMFEAADKFGIDRLKKICEAKILSSISVDNAASVFHAAELYNASTLKEKALRFILSHFDAVTKTAAFEEMGRTNVELVFDILRAR